MAPSKSGGAKDGAAEAEVDAACARARSAGNSAYTAGDLEGAMGHYVQAMACWERTVRAEDRAQSLEVGQLVQYSSKGFFGEVMSCFPLFDEYFLKDMGSDKAIWAGDIGRDLRRFSRKELVPVPRAMVDFKLAVLQNLAAVCLRQDQWEQSIKWADQALCIHGKAPKALMRKGAALLRLDQPGPASDVLATCAEEVPQDVEVRRLLREAEKKRSPMWVCATGCCGPWGIVCGGAISQVNAEVVAPARPKAAALIEEDGTSPAAAADSGEKAAAETSSKTTSSTSASGPAAAAARGEPELNSSSERTTSRQEATASRGDGAAAVAAEQRGGAIPCREEACQEERCRERRPPPRPPGEECIPSAATAAAASKAGGLDRGIVTGLLCVAAGSLMVAVLAAGWMMAASSAADESGMHR